MTFWISLSPNTPDQLISSLVKTARLELCVSNKGDRKCFFFFFFFYKFWIVALLNNVFSHVYKALGLSWPLKCKVHSIRSATSSQALSKLSFFG